ncbi:DEKNAAC104841 [Brettanomyces naardenensis]|uniref:DEKNAAC104841 n=1 Tax=Brettanomyces naardenensis TaxID=13370 RepID=A0A448YSH4_BRENA|nr:DEKNAAC104841 [Brettanomyces naardenensis]
MPSDSKYVPIAKGPEQLSSQSLTSLQGGIQASSTQDTSNHLPEDPPPYEPGSFEEFEIEDPEIEGSSSHGLLGKAGEFARNINTRIFQPIHNALDPVYEGYHYLSGKVDSWISRVGNPLIIKRLLYVLFVAVIIYIISATGNYPGRSSYYGSFHDLESLAKSFDDKIDAHRLEENLEYLSSMPHMAGTAGDLSLARYIEQYIRKTNVEELRGLQFQAFTEYPSNKSHVTLIDANGETMHECHLVEEINDDIRDDGSDDISFRAFNPGSRSGNSRGKLVYANYGSRNDYTTLRSYGVELSEFIAIIKYGGDLPAYKKLQYAKANGASAVIFISDPGESSGYTIHSIQREPVAYPEFGTGNIMDPGAGSADQIPDYFDPEKLLGTSSAYPEIPSLPISWFDFIEIMKRVKSKGVRVADWDLQIDNQNVEIWTGAEGYQVEFSNEALRRPFKEMWNVMGRIEGTEQDGLAVVIGASRDAVCYGATEASGTAVLLELMSVFSEIQASLKWHPLRSIYFVSFSGSKYNQAGASNLAVRRSDFFKRDAFAYIDLSDAVAGSKLKFSGNPLLYSFVLDKLRETSDPIQNVSLADAWDKRYDYKIDPAQNYAPFVSHIGLPSLELKFEQDGDKNSVKDSCLDTFDRFKDSKVDPGMEYHKAITSVLAKILFELSDRAVIPFDVYSLVSMMNQDARDLDSYAQIKQRDSGRRLDFNKFEQALVKMKGLGREQQSFVSTWSEIVDSASGVEPNLLAVNRWDWNSKLSVLQKVLTSPNGVYNRPWQRNVIFGHQLDLPEEYDDAGHLRSFKSSSFPGVRDALSDGNWDEAQAQLDKVSDVLIQCTEIFRLGN